jgi:hypothetical protein
MVIDRRHFIQRVAFVTTAPAIAALLPLSTRSLPPASILDEPVTQRPTSAADANSIIFTIDGWDRYDAKVPSANEVLIRVNQSWRAAWR